MHEINANLEAQNVLEQDFARIVGNGNISLPVYSPTHQAQYTMSIFEANIQYFPC